MWLFDFIDEILQQKPININAVYDLKDISCFIYDTFECDDYCSYAH